MRKLFTAIFLLLPLTASGAVHEVYPTLSIQAAVDTAVNGDTVLVHSGDYFETVVLHGKTLTIGSLFLIDGDSAHVTTTRVLASPVFPDTGSCFVYAYGEGAAGRLVGLTLESGVGTLWADSLASNICGGGIYVNGSGVTVEHCCIQNCSSEDGGGIGIGGRGSMLRSAVRLRDCIIRDCQASLYGGGVYAMPCSLLVSRCEFDANTSVIMGGGLIITGSYYELDSCRIANNHGESAAVSIGGGNGRIQSSVFDGNGLPGGEAGHLSASQTGALITGCVFRNNVGHYIAIILIGAHNQPVFVGNVVENNESFPVMGTLIVGGQVGDIAYNVFRNNSSSGCAGIQTTNSETTAHIHHNLFQNNHSADPGMGSAFHNLRSEYPTLDSNLFVGNSGPAVTFDTGPLTPTFDVRNNWWGDPSGPYHPTRNPTGQGDTLLSDSILFSPWLTTPPDTTMPANPIQQTRPKVSGTWELLTCYPNPFNSEMRIVIAGFTGRDFRLTLHNLLGQEVAVLQAGPITNGELYFAAPPFLANGVYFLRASDNQRVHTRKIVLLK